MPYKDPAMARQRVIEYRKTHRKTLAERSMRYAEANRDSVNAYQKKYREENREMLRAKGRKIRAENREEINRRNLAQWKRNPQYGVRARAKRRLRISVTIESETVITDFVKLVRNCRRIACYYCGKMISGKKAHIDHVVPLAKGGPHRPDNLCASCPFCNLSKKDKLTSEWKPPVAQQLMPI